MIWPALSHIAVSVQCVKGPAKRRMGGMGGAKDRGEGDVYLALESR